MTGELLTALPLDAPRALQRNRLREPCNLHTARPADVLQTRSRRARLADTSGLGSLEAAA